MINYKNQKIVEEVENHIAENFEYYYNSDIPVFDTIRNYLNEKYEELLPKEEKERIANIVVINMVEGMFNDNV